MDSKIKYLRHLEYIIHKQIDYIIDKDLPYYEELTDLYFLVDSEIEKCYKEKEKNNKTELQLLLDYLREN